MIAGLLASQIAQCLRLPTMNATVGDLQAERLMVFGIDNCRSAMTTVIQTNGHVFDAMKEPQRRQNM